MRFDSLVHRRGPGAALLPACCRRPQPRTRRVLTLSPPSSRSATTAHMRVAIWQSVRRCGRRSSAAHRVSRGRGRLAPASSTTWSTPPCRRNSGCRSAPPAHRQPAGRRDPVDLPVEHPRQRILGDDDRVVFPHAGASLQWPMGRHADFRFDAQGLFTLDGGVAAGAARGGDLRLAPLRRRPLPTLELVGSPAVAGAGEDRLLRIGADLAAAACREAGGELRRGRHHHVPTCRGHRGSRRDRAPGPPPQWSTPGSMNSRTSAAATHRARSRHRRSVSSQAPRAPDRPSRGTSELAAPPTER